MNTIETAAARLNSLNLDLATYLNNDALYGQCTPQEHYDWLATATDAEILSWAGSWRLEYMEGF